MAFGPCLASTAHRPPGSRASVTLTVGIGGQPHPPCTPQGPLESRTPIPPLQEALSPRGSVHCSGRGPPHSRDRPPPRAPCPEPTAQQTARRGELQRGGAAWPESPGHVEAPTAPLMGARSERQPGGRAGTGRLHFEASATQRPHRCPEHGGRGRGGSGSPTFQNASITGQWVRGGRSPHSLVTPTEGTAPSRVPRPRWRPAADVGPPRTRRQPGGEPCL